MKITELYGVLLNALIEHGDIEVECRNPAGDLSDVESVVKRIGHKNEPRLVISPYSDEDFND